MGRNWSLEIASIILPYILFKKKTRGSRRVRKGSPTQGLHGVAGIWKIFGGVPCVERNVEWMNFTVSPATHPTRLRFLYPENAFLKTRCAYSLYCPSLLYGKLASRLLLPKLACSFDCCTKTKPPIGTISTQVSTLEQFSNFHCVCPMPMLFTVANGK